MELETSWRRWATIKSLEFRGNPMPWISSPYVQYLNQTPLMELTGSVPIYPIKRILRNHGTQMLAKVFDINLVSVFLASTKMPNVHVGVRVLSF